MRARGQYGFLNLSELRQLERLRLTLRGRFETHPGRGRAGRIGDGLEFADHRAYAPGDDPRLIDWAYYARMERLTLRLAHEHSETPVTILLDASGSMGASAGRRQAGNATVFDEARRVAAVGSYLAMGGGQGVELFSFADTLGPHLRAGRDRRRIFVVLDFLGAIRPAGRTNLRAAATELAERRGPVRGGAGALLVVSDLLGGLHHLGDTLERLRLLAGQVLVLHVLPAGPPTRWDGTAVLEDAETGERLRVSLDSEAAGRHRQAVADFEALSRRACARRGIGYVRVPMDAGLRELAALALSAVDGRPAVSLNPLRGGGQ